MLTGTYQIQLLEYTREQDTEVNREACILPEETLLLTYTSCCWQAKWMQSPQRLEIWTFMQSFSYSEM